MCGLLSLLSRMVYQSYFRGEDVFMEKDGRTWMLLVSLLGRRALESPGITDWTARSVIRRAAPDLNERDKQQKGVQDR
jgi:hypothetical protein